MSEENIVKIIVTLITLCGTLAGVLTGYLAKSKQQNRIDAARKQEEIDLFKQLFNELDEVKKRLDKHNSYAEKFGEINQSMVAIKKDIEYLRKEQHDK